MYRLRAKRVQIPKEQPKERIFRGKGGDCPYLREDGLELPGPVSQRADVHAQVVVSRRRSDGERMPETPNHACTAIYICETELTTQQDADN